MPLKLAVTLLLSIIVPEPRGTNIPTLSPDSCKQKRPETDAQTQYFSHIYNLIEVGISAWPGLYTKSFSLFQIWTEGNNLEYRGCHSRRWKHLYGAKIKWYLCKRVRFSHFKITCNISFKNQRKKLCFENIWWAVQWPLHFALNACQNYSPPWDTAPFFPCFISSENQVTEMTLRVSSYSGRDGTQQAPSSQFSTEIK